VLAEEREEKKGTEKRRKKKESDGTMSHQYAPLVSSSFNDERKKEGGKGQSQAKSASH